MRSLSDIVGGGPMPARRNRGYSYRGGARFVMDVASCCTPLDRNERARLMHQAEGIERRTKAKGRKSGILGQTGLAVLRTLLLQFANRGTGLCCPSIEAIRAKTGFCKQTVIKAIRALEAVGLIRAVRRLVRRVIDGVVRAVQGTNLYSFHLDGRIVIAPLIAGKAVSFPSPMALIPLLFAPGMKTREKPHNRPSNEAREVRKWALQGAFTKA